MRGDPPKAHKEGSLTYGSTPHARGSTPPYFSIAAEIRVYPACAGIHPRRASPRTMRERLPRMRGDPPSTLLPIAKGIESTPHARGSTCRYRTRWPLMLVYPACAGIHPPRKRTGCASRRLPRMRGDPPCDKTRRTTADGSTPHARGSTLSRHISHPTMYVYPACAGIHLIPGRIMIGIQGLPRMRGDPPSPMKPTLSPSASTPHARGSTMRELGKVLRHKVYPACAGIHPGFSLADSVPGGLPRMRGDPPTRSARPPNSPASTPHARGSTC